MKSILFLATLVAMGVSATATPADSTGIEWRNGKLFVLHRVGQGQTLYSILRRYGASITDFKAANPGSTETVQFDELLRIPYTRKYNATAPKGGDAAVSSAKPTTRPGSHEVQANETLYSISRRYGVAVEDVKRWNNLPDAGGVQVGQVLVLNGETVPKKPTKSAAEIAKEQLKPVPEPKPTPPLVRTEPVRSKSEETGSEEATGPETPRSSDGPVPNAGAGARYMRETGLAEVIEVDDKSGRYLALHRTASVGTMVTVRNEANDQSVMVKIIGKLPDTGLNNRVIIKLSPGAFSRLSPVDRRFRAEVSYMRAR
ncbi:MAG: LysM peptidoglycan-binding domain-containing protein [Cytophagaceae bacterium]|nr:LysM peptidoglycan-binding domain-containing protein [Cytophagaceae bacterium]